MEWDTSDLSRNISNHLVDDDEAPIPGKFSKNNSTLFLSLNTPWKTKVLSPLETAQAPLEILIDLAKTKIESVEFLSRCDTPPPMQITDYNKAMVSQRTGVKLIQRLRVKLILLCRKMAADSEHTSNIFELSHESPLSASRPEIWKLEFNSELSFEAYLRHRHSKLLPG